MKFELRELENKEVEVAMFSSKSDGTDPVTEIFRYATWQRALDRVQMRCTAAVMVFDVMQQLVETQKEDAEKAETPREPNPNAN